MAIDGASVTTVQDSNRPQNLDSGTKIKVANRENEMNRAGQASENGQEVVANFSAAALETSRAAAEVSQGAEKNRLESSTDRYESRPQPPPEDSKQKIDVMA